MRTTLVLFFSLSACGRTGLDDLSTSTGADAGPAVAMPMQLPPRSPLVLAEVTRGFTALTHDEDFIYFAASGPQPDIDRVAQVPRLGGQVVELASRPTRWEAKRSLVRVGNFLLVASEQAFYLVPTMGGPPQLLQPAPVRSVNPAVGHVMHSNGQLAVWLAADGVLYAARRGTSGLEVAPLAVPEGPLQRRLTGAVFVDTASVFFAATWPDANGKWEGHLTRFGHEGRRVATRIVVDRATPPRMLATNGPHLTVAFGGYVDTVSSDTLAPVDSSQVGDLFTLALYPAGGWVELKSRTPDPFGGKLEALSAIARLAPNGVPNELSPAGHPSLGGALLTEPGALYWVRRKGPDSSSPALIERVPLP